MNKPKKSSRRAKRSRIKQHEDPQIARDGSSGKYFAEADLLHKTLNSVGDAIFVLDAASPPTIKDCNEAASSIFGYGKGEMLGKSTEFLHASKTSLSEFQSKLYAAVDQDRLPFHLSEHHMKRKNGTIFPSEHFVSKLVTQIGGFRGWVSIVRDITEHKRMEERLRESELRFRLMFENMADAVAVYEVVDRGSDYVIRDFNKAAERIENVRGEDVIGRSVMNVFPGVKEFGLLDVFQRVWKTGKSERYPTAFYKDKRIVGWRENYVYKLPSNEIVAVYQDVTEHKQMEENLKESSERLEKLVDERTRELDSAREMLEHAVSSNPAVLYIAKPLPDYSDYEATFISKSIVSILGFEAEELVGRSGAQLWERRIPPEDFRKFRSEMPALWKDGQHAFEYRFLHKDGKYRWIHEEQRVIRDGEGRVQDVVGYWIDVTDRKRLEEELVKSQRLAVIGETTRMVAHDLRNPLQGITGATDILKKHLGSSTDAVTMEMLDVLEEDVAYSNKILIDLLDYSQQPQIVAVETGLKTIISKSLQTVQVPNGVTVQDQTDDLRIMVDPQIQRVFVNLIKNAYDAMPNGGVLRISSKASSETVQISFSDTGAGISDDVQRKLWKEPVTTKAKGLGMGLAISKKIVEAHGGSLLLENNVEHGAVATVTLSTKPRLGGE